MVSPVILPDCPGVSVIFITPEDLVERGELSWIMVRLLTVGLAVPAPVIVVCPLSVMPFVMSTREVQLNVPAGSVIISPSNATLRKDCTFA